MSYDLMVFEPTAAPRDPHEFREWYRVQAEWAEDRDYSNPAGAAPKLVEFYHAMRNHFPAMNGPDATQDDNELERSADYCIGSHVIYATFPWSLAEEVYPVFRETAVQTGVGFYDVSGDDGEGEIYFPGDKLRSPSGGAWREIAKQFRELEGGQ